MKIGVSAYSFARLVNSGGLDGDKVLDKAKEMGFDCIEFAGLYLPAGRQPVEYAKELCERAKTLGIEITNYCTGANFITNDIDAEVERVKRDVDIAYALGARMIRHDVAYGPMPGGYKSFEKNLDMIVYGAKKVTEYAKSLGIETMTENHGYFAQDSNRVEMLIDAVHDDNYGALIDIGNFLCADEAPEKAVGVLKSYVKHVHCKDFYFKSGNGLRPMGPGWFKSRGGNYLKGATVGDGVVPVAQCIDILKSSGYDGVLSIEYEGCEDVIACINGGKEYIKKCCGIL